MEVTFWGVRGSIPAPGPATVRYGGNTPCVEVRTGENELLILDCGTGIRELGLKLAAQGPVSGHILLSHAHWDHIQGFPFFAPALMPGNEFTVYAAHDQDQSLADLLAGQQEYPYFPLSLGQMAATMHFHEITEPAITVQNLLISLHELHHTQPATGFRIESGGKALAYISDHEFYGVLPEEVIAAGLGDWQRTGRYPQPGVQPGDRAFLEFIAGVDLLIIDAQYNAAEYPAHLGWGHSAAEIATDFAVAAGAKQVALFHHDPNRSDDDLDVCVRACQERARSLGARVALFAAREGQTVRL